MKPHKRILVLGCTGVNKREVVLGCLDLLDTLGHTAATIDFERDYLPKSLGRIKYSGYLSNTLEYQSMYWADAWKLLRQDLCSEPYSSTTTFLCVHGTIVRDWFGVRPAIEVASLARDFRPSLIITLIDDLYRMWWRTEARAGGELHRGRPTLEQLLMARRSEMIIGDLLVKAMTDLGASARHILLSVNHPIRTMVNLVLGAERLCYLSFPISAPRELDGGDEHNQRQACEIRKGIADLHSEGLVEQLRDPNFCAISPLSIDELPFALQSRAQRGRDTTHFDYHEPSYRWPLKDVWGGEPLLVSSDVEACAIPIAQASAVVNLLETDVGWRDYRLALQASFLGAYSPVVPRTDGKIRQARGVTNEIEKAWAHGIPIYVYQDPSFDPSNAFDAWVGTPGTMGSNDKSTWIQKVDSVSDVVTGMRKVKK